MADKLVEESDICKATFKVAPSVKEACLQVVQDILEFFQTSSAMAPMNILELRKINGPGFNFNTAKALLNIRIDFTSAERNEALTESKKVRQNYRQFLSNNNYSYWQSIKTQLEREINLRL